MSHLAAVAPDSVQELDGNLSVRDRLIDVAAAHFAEYGLQGASQRAIQREVGVNPSAANYHFGSKQALFLAVIEDVMQPLQAQRARNLDKLLASKSSGPVLTDLLRGYLAPLLHGAETQRGYSYLRILMALYARPDFIDSTIHSIATDMWERYVDQLSKAFPTVSRNRIYQVLRIVVCVAAQTRIPLGPEPLSQEEKLRLVNEVTEMSAIIFSRLCGGEE